MTYVRTVLGFAFSCNVEMLKTSYSVGHWLTPLLF